MTRLVLDFWNRRWQSVSYDKATGKGRIRWLHGCPESSDGWAYRHRGEWFAVWKDNDRLVFQAGLRWWYVDSGSDVEFMVVEDGAFRHLTLSRNGTVEFEVMYKPSRCDWDPTFDDLDDEMTDFFLWLSRLQQRRR